MKNINIYSKISVLLVAILFFASCNEDFLERFPQDQISDAVYWNSENDFKEFVNGFYNFVSHDDRVYAKYAAWENGTDNIMGVESIPFPSTRIYRINSSAPQNNTTWSAAYSRLRNINYFLTQKDKVPAEELTNIGKHYIGEAYFFRAYINYMLLNNFGDAPLIVSQVNVDDTEELYKPRTPRYELAMQIMEDLDLAIENLQWAGSNPAGQGRINKEAALAYKVRYALFEGSWERYHSGTVFGVSGKDGSEFLEMVVDAGDQLIAHLGNEIFKGSAGQEYFDIFNKKDYSSVPGVFHYQTYSIADGITHRWKNFSYYGGQIGLTKSAVDDYLMMNGEPKEINTEDYQGDDTFVDLTTNRDPRLEQTIYFKEKWGTKGDLLGLSNSDEMAGITTDHVSYPSRTGYYIAKGISKEDQLDFVAESGLIYMRYAEVLLSYAEAKAILGTILQSDIDKSINVLRDRVGMGHMDLANIQSWESNSSYVKRYADESALINEIRRERRIELMLEGQRYDDLRRWRSFGELINGWVPKGAKAQQFIDYWGPIPAVSVDPNGYLVPGGFRADFDHGGSGFIVDEDRDYLYPIPLSQITLYENSAGVELTQNPGWR